MPLVYTVDTANHIVRAVGTGALTIEELRDYFVETRADPRVDDSMHRIMDLRPVTKLPTSPEIRDVAALARGMPPADGARMAILVSSDLGFGVGMMFSGFAGFAKRLFIFRDEEDAMAWLTDGTPPADAAPY